MHRAFSINELSTNRIPLEVSNSQLEKRIPSSLPFFSQVRLLHKYERENSSKKLPSLMDIKFPNINAEIYTNTQHNTDTNPAPEVLNPLGTSTMHRRA